LACTLGRLVSCFRRYPNGDRYEGKWLQGQKNGRGEYTYCPLPSLQPLPIEAPATGCSPPVELSEAAGGGTLPAEGSPEDTPAEMPLPTKAERAGDASAHDPGASPSLADRAAPAQGPVLGQTPVEASAGPAKLPAVKYRGQFSQSLAEGEGDSLMDGGDRYYGGYRGGERSGRGAYKWKVDGRIHRGEWAAGKANGYGILTRPKPDSESESGSESDDHLNDDAHDTMARKGAANKKKKKKPSVGRTHEVLLPGQNLDGAKQQAINGQEVTLYEGSFKHGLFHGKGVEYEYDVAGRVRDAVYEGPFHDGDRESYGDVIAFGRRTDSRGSLFVGWYHLGLPHGTHGDNWDAHAGSRYIGSWFKGMRHGTGKRWSKDGSTYEGNWRKDKPHGRGRSLFKNGDEFVGEYFLGARNGPGFYTRPDGADTYLGYWQHGIARGRGLRRYANGAFYLGDVDKNLPHGEGLMKHGDGVSWFWGGWRWGRRHGAGIELNGVSGARFEGVWRDGVKDNTLTGKDYERSVGRALTPRTDPAWLVRDAEGNDFGVEGAAKVSKYAHVFAARSSGSSVGSQSSYGESRLEGDTRSAGLVTHPSRYFDPVVHTHVMVQRWNKGKLVGEYADVAPAVLPRMPGDLGFDGREEDGFGPLGFGHGFGPDGSRQGPLDGESSVSSFGSSLSPLRDGSLPMLAVRTTSLARPASPGPGAGVTASLAASVATMTVPPHGGGFSATRRRRAGDAIKRSEARHGQLPKGLTPSQEHEPAPVVPVQLSLEASELRRRTLTDNLERRTPYVASDEGWEDRRRVAETCIYAPGDWMIVLVDDELVASAATSALKLPSHRAGGKVDPPPVGASGSRFGVAAGRRWVEARVVRFMSPPSLHLLKLCLGTPLEPELQAVEGVLLALTPMNHLSHPIDNNHPPIRTTYLPAPRLDVTARRAELRAMRQLLACQPSEFSREQAAVSSFVEDRARKVVQDALDKAEKLRQDNIEARAKRVAEEQAAMTGMSFA